MYKEILVECKSTQVNDGMLGYRPVDYGCKGWFKEFWFRGALRVMFSESVGSFLRSGTWN